MTDIVEVNGVKLEVDLRSARKIDTLRIGSRVKVLRKEYGGEFRVSHGVVVAFDQFQNLPTINVCYLEMGYLTTELKFIAINAQTKDAEIVAANDDDQLEVSKSDVLARIDSEIEKKRREIEDLDQRRSFFLSHFAAFFGEEQRA